MSTPAGEEPPEPTGTLRPTSARALTTSIVVGLVAGWSLHPLGEAISGRPPVVSWAQPATLVLVVAIMGFLAWHTWQSVQVRRERLEPQRAVNRLVLARSCALGGALVAAAYVGYAIGWLGDESRYADRFLLRALVAAAAAAGVSVASLVLERACRTDGGRPQP